MRVLHVSGGVLSSESGGGAERCCLELSQWLVSSGIDVLIAAPTGPGAQPFHSMAPLLKMNWKPLRKLFFDYVSPANVRRLRRIIAEFQPDLVHVHNIYGIASQLIRVASEHAPTLVTVHDYWPVDVFVPRVRHGRLQYPRRQQLLLPWVWAHRAIHRRYLRGATLVSPSRYLARRLEQFGYRDVRVIVNGVTLPAETTAGDASILFVGRLAPEKGLQEVLGPVEQVAREFGWRIDVVGDGPLRARLERAFPLVRFHGWADPAPFYRQAGIVLVPSIWPENLPYVILEAMSYGVPVLASNVGGIPELVAAGATGMLFEPGNSEQFANALREMAADRAWLRRAGVAARSRVVERFTWETVRNQYLRLYRDMMEPPALDTVSAQLPPSETSTRSERT